MYASTVNVRDKVAGFIVGLAGMSDRWDKDASPALLRCRSGLGRSSDPKVVALRQAVLEKCMAFKGPSPNLGRSPDSPQVADVSQCALDVVPVAPVHCSHRLQCKAIEGSLPNLGTLSFSSAHVSQHVCFGVAVGLR